ncbi:hypothetical protein [Clostridium algidicarnis]|uniref:hypothetical protein n=1 Tax=Clostridium algidicarnis TaxID=37659 RepID=UPI001C0CEF1C|nr:hypothetical protein [Clostridium algidicarnis]MBU3204401.1 hypothetical protein [Clostridium algidicarnis]MBU3212516.1 hypothetical protein [Clostridium algidicarnis]MBU3222947.1 hypothetical protein [Clostridium algidicarnis]
MIKISRNSVEPQSLTIEKNKRNGTYNTPEVVKALNKDFHNKCYLCESKNLKAINIEHFRSHGGDKELMFNWQNLFLSCSHCNNIKLDKYDNILDCTKVDVDELLCFRKKGQYGWEEVIEVTILVNNEETKSTVELLEKIYNGTTQMKILESSNIRKELRNEILDFIKAINEYYSAEGEDKEDAKFLIKRNLKASSPFAAFKRWIIRDNKENLLEFLDGEGIKCLV